MRHQLPQGRKRVFQAAPDRTAVRRALLHNRPLSAPRRATRWRHRPRRELDGSGSLSRTPEEAMERCHAMAGVHPKGVRPCPCKSNMGKPARLGKWRFGRSDPIRAAHRRSPPAGVGARTSRFALGLRFDPCPRSPAPPLLRVALPKVKRKSSMPINCRARSVRERSVIQGHERSSVARPNGDLNGLI